MKEELEDTYQIYEDGVSKLEQQTVSIDINWLQIRDAIQFSEEDGEASEQIPNGPIKTIHSERLHQMDF